MWVATSVLPAGGDLPRQLYEVLAVTKLDGDRYVGCHKLPFPYRVYQCHMTAGLTDKAYVVSLRGLAGGGPTAKMLAFCHFDTAKWNPAHPAFEVLGYDVFRCTAVATTAADPWRRASLWRRPDCRGAGPRPRIAVPRLPAPGDRLWGPDVAPPSGWIGSHRPTWGCCLVWCASPRPWRPAAIVILDGPLRRVIGAAALRCASSALLWRAATAAVRAAAADDLRTVSIAPLFVADGLPCAASAVPGSCGCVALRGSCHGTLHPARDRLLWSPALLGGRWSSRGGPVDGFL
ncbi:BURP domain-containing protein 13-like [Hordeum vulgare]|nr:BURP domain-containing protein 13-like [Hordeum vulgare]